MNGQPSTAPAGVDQKALKEGRVAELLTKQFSALNLQRGTYSSHNPTFEFVGRDPMKVIIQFKGQDAKQITSNAMDYFRAMGHETQQKSWAGGTSFVLFLNKIETNDTSPVTTPSNGVHKNGSAHPPTSEQSMATSTLSGEKKEKKPGLKELARIREFLEEHLKVPSSDYTCTGTFSPEGGLDAARIADLTKGKRKKLEEDGDIQKALKAAFPNAISIGFTDAYGKPSDSFFIRFREPKKRGPKRGDEISAPRSTTDRTERSVERTEITPPTDQPTHIRMLHSMLKELDDEERVAFLKTFDDGGEREGEIVAKLRTKLEGMFTKDYIVIARNDPKFQALLTLIGGTPIFVDVDQILKEACE